MTIMFGFLPFWIVSKPIRCLHIHYTQSEVMHWSPIFRTSLSLGWNAIVVPERKAKRFTAASTPFHIKHHFTPVTHVAEEDNQAGNWRTCIRQRRHACPQQHPPYWCHRGCQLVPWFLPQAYFQALSDASYRECFSWIPGAWYHIDRDNHMPGTRYT